MALVVLFSLFDSITKILKVPAVVEASAQLGVNESQLVGRPRASQWVALRQGAKDSQARWA